MAGLASIIFLSRPHSAEADIGETCTLPAIAAVFNRCTSLFGGVAPCFGTFVGRADPDAGTERHEPAFRSANWHRSSPRDRILAVWLDMKTRRRT